MINWRVRVLSSIFWLGLIPAVLILIQAVLRIFGIEWDYTELNSQLAAVVEAAFAVLIILGIVNDPTVSGWSDSLRALKRLIPAPNARQEVEDGDHADHFTGGDGDE